MEFQLSLCNNLVFIYIYVWSLIIELNLSRQNLKYYLIQQILIGNKFTILMFS